MGNIIINQEAYAFCTISKIQNKTVVAECDEKDDIKQSIQEVLDSVRMEKRKTTDMNLILRGDPFNLVIGNSSMEVKAKNRGASWTAKTSDGTELSSGGGALEKPELKQQNTSDDRQINSMYSLEKQAEKEKINAERSSINKMMEKMVFQKQEGNISEAKVTAMEALGKCAEIIRSGDPALTSGIVNLDSQIRLFIQDIEIGK
ncbi:hypothetical protein [Candidatus Hydrogenosomobacter endosymbioticus]|uniref:hypothetical protein n=1 Tax=Candidatus Hydrogenosomobacter endosymbioticus TaxID=2558174 RepID=UPI001F434098|nr:hypothetical protein [Candidatus Hydrogenosomobacter endosymbioticus]